MSTMRKIFYKKISILFLFTLIIFNFYCGNNVLEKIQNFKTNVPPEIVVFTSDSPGGATLYPNQIFHIHVEAFDVNGNKITFKFDSPVGAFSGQIDTATTSDVVFTLPGVLTPGFVAIARVTVSDEKGASKSQDLNLGSGHLGATITTDASVVTYPYLKTADWTAITWTADADGFFQVQSLPNVTNPVNPPSSTCAMDTSPNGIWRFYAKGTVVTVIVAGTGVALNAAGLPLNSPTFPGTTITPITYLDNGTGIKDSNSYKVCIGVRDALTQSSFVGGTTGITFTLDNAPPNPTTITPVINNQVFSTPQNIIFNCTDALSSCKDLSYTVDYLSGITAPAGITPNFTGTGTILSYTKTSAANVYPTVNASPSVNIGNQGDGSYKLNVLSRDAENNVESVVATYNFQVNASVPQITVSAPSPLKITSTGDTVNFGSSNITWSATEGGLYKVMINPIDATAPCGLPATPTNSTGTNASGTAVLATNYVSNIKPVDLAEGTNNIYICVHDGFAYGWSMVQVIKDNTSPVAYMNPVLNGATFLSSQTTTFGCTDANNCRISYLQAYNANTKTALAGTIPDFSGTNGTILNGPLSNNITLGNQGDGTYTVTYVSRDELGNPVVLTANTVSFSVNTTTPVITAGNPTNPAITRTGNTAGFGTSNITWSSSDNGTYIVMINQACPAWPGDTAAAVTAYAGAGKAKGANNSGSLTANQNITTTIDASLGVDDASLVEGSNTIRICTNDGFSTAEKTITIIRDNTPPVTTMSPNLNGLSYASSQTVTFNCADTGSGCAQIGYTEDKLAIAGGIYPAVIVPNFTATAPQFLINGSSGSVILGATNAMKYTAAFLSKDNVGNTETFSAPINQAQYNIDSTLPTVTRVSGPTNSFVTVTAGGITSSTITWSANKTGTYYVNINRVCQAATNSTGANATAAYGTIGTNITSTILSSDLLVGANSINICLWDPILSMFGVVTVNITRDDAAPVVSYSPNINGTTIAPQSVTFSCADTSGAGCASMRYTIAFNANSSVTPALTGPTYTSPAADAGTGTLIAGASGNVTLGNSGDGTYKLMYIGRDMVGNIAAAGTIVFYVNQVQPIATFVSGPSNPTVTSTGNTVSFGSSSITWRANEVGQTYLVNINAACPSNAAWPGTGTTTVTSTVSNIVSTVAATATGMVANSDNTINICLNDGFVTTTLSKIIYRDDVKPVSAYTPAIAGATFASAQNITLSCTDAVSCAAMSYTQAFSPNTTTAPAAITPDFAGTGTVINNSSGLATVGNQGDGTYTISRISKDSVGNVETAVSFSFSVDGLAPGVNAGSPTQATVTTTGSTIAFFGTTYHNTSITWSTNHASIPYYVTVNAVCAGSSNIGVSGTSNAVAGNTTITTISASAVAPWVAGSNTIRICVFDGFSTASSTGMVNLDNSAPLSSPTITQTGFTGTSGSFSVSSTADTIYYDYGTDGVNYSTPNTLSTTPNFTVSGLTAGTPYTLYVRGYDAVGNVTGASTFGFTPGYTITVNVSGAPASPTTPLTLQRAAGDSLTFSTIGSKTFSAHLANSTTFSISTTQQLVNTPAYHCVFVENAWGTIASANVTLNVNCTQGYVYANSFTYGDPAAFRTLTTDSLYVKSISPQPTPTSMVLVGGVIYFTTFSDNEVKFLNISNQAVTALAGSAGLSGHVDGMGTAARFNTAAGITSDGTNLYVTDLGNYIRKIKISNGNVTTIAGNGTAGSADNATNPLLATFNNPTGIAYWNNSLIIIDTGNQKVRKMDLTTGAVSTIAGTGVAGYLDGAGSTAKFSFGGNWAGGIAVDSLNNVAYISDYSNNRIRKIDLLTNIVSTVAGDGTLGEVRDGLALQARISTPGAITLYKDKLIFYDYNGTGTCAVRALNLTTGFISTLTAPNGWASMDGTADTARLKYSIAMVTDGKDIYFADHDAGVIKQLTNDLAVQYTFDDAGTGTSKDSSGNSLDGTLYNGPTAGVDENGLTNGAYKFNGSTQYIRRNVVSTLINNITMSAWVKLNNYGPDYQTVISNGNGTGNGYMMMINPTGYPHLSMPGVSGISTNTLKVQLNKWEHVLFKRDAGTWYAYVNGIPVSFISAPGAPWQPSTYTTIGMSGGSPTYYLSGSISDARIYKRALTAREIKRLASQVPDGLVRYYPLDGDATDANVLQKNATVPSTTGGLYAAATPDVDRFNYATGSYKFDGTDDYISAPDANLPGGSSASTMCAWVIQNSQPGTYWGFVNYGTAANGQRRGVYEYPNQIAHNGYAADHVVNYFMPAGTWTHVCATASTISGTQVSSNIYVNGALTGTPATLTWNTVSSLLRMGVSAEAGSPYFPGNIDDVRIYGKALNATEITTLANPSGTQLNSDYSGTYSYVRYNILPGESHTFRLPVTSNYVNSIWWDDSLAGSGVPGATNVTVSAAYETSGTSIFTNVDSGYSTGSRFIANASDNVLITVNNAGATAGTYGIRSQYFTKGTLTSATPATYTPSVIAGKTYTIWWDDTYSGSGVGGTFNNNDVKVSATGLGANFTNVDSGYNPGQTFTATGTGTITITVAPFNSCSTVACPFGLMMTQP